MFNFKYEIKRDDEGRPYVNISKDNIDDPEHKFMAIEITRYLLNSLLEDNQELKELEEQTIVEIVKAGHVLQQISQQIGTMISEQNNALDELGLDVKDDE